MAADPAAPIATEAARSDRMEPPAPAEQPPLAELNVFNPAVQACPYATYRRLRAEAPVLRDAPTGIYQISSYDLVCQAAMDPATFSNAFGAALRGRGGPSAEAVEIMKSGYPPMDTMLTADDPEHARYRKLVFKAFTPARVSKMGEPIAAIVNDLIDGFIGAGEVELASAFSQPLPLRVIAGELGVPVADLPQFKKWSAAFVTQLSQMSDKAAESAAARDIVEFQHYFAAKLAERRQHPRDDILSDLANVTLSEEGDPRALTTAEALSIIQQLLVAGNETTAHTITEGMKLLIEHPDQMAAVRADPSLIGNLIEEVLRLLSPTQNMWRVVKHDTELGGVPIPAGAVALLRYGSANRDESLFADAESFDIRRPNARRHVAFGYGIHVCIGAALARKELAVAFELLLSRIANWRFTPGRNDFHHPPSILLRGLHALHLSFEAN
jgi:cytochrome P450